MNDGIIKWYKSKKLDLLHRIDGPVLEWQNGDQDLQTEMVLQWKTS